MVSWLTTQTDSDIAIAGNVLLSKVLDRVGEAAANLNITIPGSATRAAQWHSSTVQPNNSKWQDGNCTVLVKIITGFANVQCAVNVVREDPTGANIEQQTLQPEQTTVSGTTLTFNFGAITWTAGDVTDRIRLRVQFRTTTGTARTVTFEIGVATSVALDFPVTLNVNADGHGTGGGSAAATAATRANLTAAGTASASASGAHAGRANLTGAGAAAASAAGASSARANLAGSAAAAASASGSLKGTAGLTGSASGVATARGIGKGRANLTGSGMAGAAAAGGLRGTAALTGSASAGASAAGALGRIVQIVAHAFGGAAAAGAMTSLAQLIGEAKAGASASGDLRGSAGLTGSASAGAAASGALKGTAAMTGSAFGGAAAAGALTTIEAAAVGCFERIVQAVRDRYVAQIEVAESVATLHDNEPPQDMGSFDVWVRFTVTAEPTTQLDLGAAGMQDHRYLGAAVARIFLRRGLGDGDAWDLADAINAAFRGVTADEVIYSPPPYPTVRGADGDRWELDVTVPFYGLCAEEALV